MNMELQLENIKLTIFFILTCTMLIINQLHAESERCNVFNKFSCTPKECIKLPTTKMWYIIDFDKNEYMRCKEKLDSCKTYQMIVNESERYYHIQAKNIVMNVKLSKDKSQFMEIVSTKMKVHISYGRCSLSPAL